MIFSYWLFPLDPGKAFTLYRVRTWDIENGLPGNCVYAITQTRDGYMWFGTQDGLVRFDGIAFSTFSNKNFPQIKDNVIRSLYQGRDGTLWIGTATGGLLAYKDREFTAYPVDKFPALARLNAINEDRWGNIWFGSSSRGLTCFSEGKFTTYTTGDGLPRNQVRTISKSYGSEKNSETLWVTTSAGIVNIIEPGVFRYYAPNTRLPYFKTASLYNAGTRELWIGTGDRGLFRLKDRHIQTLPHRAGTLHPTITELYMDRQKTLWIGTDGGGLSRLAGGEVTTLKTGKLLKDGFVYSIYEDREGSLWVGTIDGGLHQFSDTRFTTLTTREGLTNDYVQALCLDRSGKLWIGTKGGLDYLQNNRVTPAVLTARTGLLDESVTSLRESPEGHLWIGTWGGLHRFKPGDLKSFTVKDGLSDNRVTQIFIDRNRTTWIGTMNGLNRYHSTPSSFSILSPKQGLSGSSVNFIFQDSRGRILVGTELGLNVIKGDSIIAVTIGNNDKKNVINCAHEDSNGTLWFGSENGLVRLPGKLDGQSRFIYTTRHGLANNFIYAIMEDSYGYLWLAGQNGISRVKKSRLDQMARGTVSRLQPDSYNETDGMKARWCTNAAVVTPDGRFWFGTGKGLAFVDPGVVDSGSARPVPLIEKILVNGEPVPLKKCRGKLELPPGKKRLEFYYTAPGFIDPKNVRFKIMLEGYDNDWLDMGTLRNTTYTGLTPGEYTFQLTAGNPGDTHGKQIASCKIYLTPFFYQTTWFYVSAVFFILVTTLLIHWLRIRHLKARQIELSRKVDIRTSQLKERNVELEMTRQNILRTNELVEAKNRQLEEQAVKLQELDQVKSRFFANISHEFRTPLTLIKGPLEQILDESLSTEMENRAKMMLRNSNRLLNLVDQLLELAKFDSGKVKLKTARQNIVAFVKSVTMCFQSLALQNKITLDFHGEPDDLPLYFDPGKTERIIFNFLSNAFNYTPSGGEIFVSVGQGSGAGFDPGYARVSVRDTGPGIPKDQLPHIFERFYRGEANHEYRRKGTGIGLALTRELVELHHGDINVFSSCRPGADRGTEFVIRLPLGNAHLKADEIIDTTMICLAGECREFVNGSIDEFTTGYTHDDEDPEEEKGQEESAESEDGAKREKPLILAVDDNSDVREYIKGALRSQFDIKLAINGKEGVEKAMEIIPDLIISDVMMPEMDGFELCAALKSDIKTSHIPIILLTARASEESVIKGLDTGADDYVGKPFNINILTSRVKNLIRLRRQMQQNFQNSMKLQPAEIAISSIDTKFIEELKEVIEKNISNPDLNVEYLADKMYMSRSTLYRKIEALTGDSPQVFMRAYRLKRAAQLLEAKFGNITEVAFEVGFSSAAYFAKCFKKKFHCRPSEYVGT